MKTINLPKDAFEPMMSGILEKKGWVLSEKNGEVVYSMPKSFGGTDLCFSDAWTLQTMIDRWGETEMTINPAVQMQKIREALRDDAAVFERLKHNKPDDHIYHLLHKNTVAAIAALNELTASMPSAKPDDAPLIGEEA